MKFNSNYWMLIACVVGVICGLVNIPAISALAHGISDVFLNLLKLISLPLIFLAILSTITSMKSLKEAKSILSKTVKYTIGTTVLAATIALGLFLLINPVGTIDTSNATQIAQDSHSYLHYLSKVIPSNPIQPFIENNVIGVAFMAAILSLAILSLPSRQKETLQPFFKSLFDALLKIAGFIIKFLPLGIFAFALLFIEGIRENSKSLKPILLYASVVIGANLVQGLIALPILLKARGISPIKHAKGMWPAITMAFFSKSSNATLPITMRCANERLNISTKTSSFTLPLCSIINMNGCAAFILTTTLFVSMSCGMTFSPLALIAWIAIASLAAIGNAGIPMGCFFLTSSLLLGMGVPLEMMGLILPLYALIDMIETALNVYSDSCITAIVDKELIDQKAKEVESALPIS